MLALLTVSLPAQRQFDELRKRALPSDARGIPALGDVDGDGDQDAVFALRGQNRLYLNDGSGTFTDVTTGRLPADTDDTRALAFGDVDGDGDLDLVCGNHGTFGEQNRLYLNDGHGTFIDVTAGQMPVSSDGTAAVVLGDVDGDGDLDLVCGNGGDPNGSTHLEQNRLYLNDGRGTFVDVTTLRMPNVSDATNALAFGDVDGDGDLDLVCGNLSRFSTPTNRLYLNDGGGTFSDATTGRLPGGEYDTQALALGDVDGDGDLDLVCANADQGTSLLNRLYMNDGRGTFVDATVGRMPGYSDLTLAVALGDVDGDGDLDLVCGNRGYYSTQVRQDRLYLNNGRGGFSDFTFFTMPVDEEQTAGLALGDVDGDGDLDMLLGGRGRLYVNSGRGTFADATAGRMPLDRSNTKAAALGDVDGDGDLDMVCGNTGGIQGISPQNRLYLNNGRGTFADAPGRLPADSDGTHAVALGDVDGDGDLDIACGNERQNRLYLNNGSGFFADVTAARMPVVDDQTEAVALGDVDGDGDLDIVFASRDQNRLYLNDGSGVFVDVSVTRLPAGSGWRWPNAVALGDVDGDGDLDLVFGNGHSRGQNELYLNGGDGTFTDATAGRLPVDDNSNTTSVAFGDVDGDGDLDLVFGNRPTWAQTVLCLNDGRGTFTDATSTHMPVDNDDTSAMALGDVDGDGDLDLVLGGGASNRLYLNGGNGVFTDATDVRLQAGRASAMALGDVDGDGDLDLVCGLGGLVPSLYVNLFRQLDVPYLSVVGRTFTLEAYARYNPPSAAGLALPFLAGATASIPLGPLGTLGLAPAQLVALAPVVIPQPAGVASIRIAIPDVPSLIGGVVYAQALVVPYPFAPRLTNVTAEVLGQ